MKKVLGRKQSMKPADEKVWWDVINNIEEYVSQDEVARATDIARARILKMTSGKKAAYSWSGGKDSLVISSLCRSVGITSCQCLIKFTEFPIWEKWLMKNAPPNCEVLKVGFNLNYLAEHEELLFARGKLGQRWLRDIQQKYFRKYLKERNLDIVILGHRTIDGNVCGKNGVRIQKQGGILYSPIHDWSHELVFAFLHYNKIELPFMYKWYRGFYNGTCGWAQRTAGSVNQAWQEVYDIDPSVVIQAAEKLPSARKFLEEMKNANSNEKYK